LDQGHHIRLLDREAEADIPGDVLNFIQGADYQQVDITDYGSLRPHFVELDAVVHLAAIPFPRPGMDAEIFDINCAGTFNVYQAAAEADIRRVVSASSINALGNKFGIRPTPLHYFPIDEDHPPSTSDVYSFSKQIVEETAAYFWRREVISGVCLRIPYVYDPAQMSMEAMGQNLRDIKQAYEALKAMSHSERQAALQTVQAQSEAVRQQRMRGEITREEMFQKIGDLPYQAILFGRQDFWALLDVRDVAHAIYLALTAEYEGSHVLNIADQVNGAGLPTVELAALLYPEVTTWKRPVSGVETLFSIDKARELIGFAPQHSISQLVAGNE
jgi:nucleoside-diphosphate-sugar epimerase